MLQQQKTEMCAAIKSSERHLFELDCSCSVYDRGFLFTFVYIFKGMHEIKGPKGLHAALL